MNFLCHALPYLDDPLVAVATGVPDWMSMVDRKVRVRGKSAAQFIDSPDDAIARVARGVLHHVDDDRWFHSTEAFVSTNLELAVQLRDLLRRADGKGDDGFRPTFVGHIVIEMLLDSLWIRDDRSKADSYYAAVASVDADEVQRAVVAISGKPVSRLTDVIGRFVDAAFLYDYLTPEGMLFRINQVMGRVGLSQLPPETTRWLAETSKLVESRRVRLLTPPDGRDPFALGDP
jgi:hypothetical protein